MKKILIVSDCRVTSDIAEAEILYNDETTGITVGVNKFAADKCPRCWKRRREVAENGLCDRCRDVIGK